MQSIIFALGLEGMLSASQKVPLGEAMTRVVDTTNGRGAILESSVTLTLKNQNGTHLRVRRHPVSADTDSRLIQTWAAPGLDELDQAERQDCFVRFEGAAQRPRGFQRILAEFIGWDIPTVPSFSATDIPLYLEVLFPLFYVEQKYGWSGIAPRVPTHYRMREPLRRGVEFVLGLSTLDRIKRRTALREQLQVVTSEWQSLVSAARELAARNNWAVSLLDEQPLGPSQRRNAILQVFISNRLRPLSYALEEWRAEASRLSTIEIPAAGPRTEEARSELADAEAALTSLSVDARRISERLDMARADSEAIGIRLGEIEADKRRLQDLQRLERLGGTLELAVLSDALCPTCQQELDGRHVGTGLVQSVAETVAALDGERKTLIDLQSSVAERRDLLHAQLGDTSQALHDARLRVRLLRDEISGLSEAPSLAAVQYRLDLNNRGSSQTRV